MAADLSFGGTDDENAELRKLHTEVVSLARPFTHLGTLTYESVVGESR